MVEGKRSAPRHRILKAATISFGGGAISCTVRNLSLPAPGWRWRHRSEFPTQSSSKSQKADDDAG